MTILLISIKLIMKKWNNNNNLDYETTAVPLIILWNPAIALVQGPPDNSSRAAIFSTPLTPPKLHLSLSVNILTTNQHNYRRPCSLEWLHQAPMLLVSIFFDRVTAHLTHTNESLNMSLLLTHLDSYRHLSTRWSVRDLRAGNIFTGRPLEPYLNEMWDFRPCKVS